MTEPATLTEAIFGKELINAPAFSKARAWPAELRATLAAVLLASAVLLPYLGAVGLWDPWETHYGEVAREMIQRNDYVHPYWENAWFFSKPAFTMWMQAVGLQAADAGATLALVLGVLLGAFGFALYTGKVKGSSAVKEFWGVLFVLAGLFALVLFAWGKSVNLPWKFGAVASGPGALPLFTEWGFRLPFAGFSIVAIGLMTYALSLTVSPRAGMASAFVLVTMPLYFLLSRQAVTDTPIVSATICGISCAMVALFDKASKHTSAWWFGAYVFFGVATLAKGLLGFGVPMVVWFLYAALRHGSTDWFFQFCRWCWTYKTLRLAAYTVLAAQLLGLVVAAAMPPPEPVGLTAIFTNAGLPMDLVRLQQVQPYLWVMRVLAAVNLGALATIGVVIALNAPWRKFWVVRHLAVPVGAGVGAGLVAAIIASSLGKAWNTTFMAVPIVDNQTLISAPTWLGIMWGSLVFWIVATVMLGRSKTATTEAMPSFVQLAYDMRLGTGLLVFLAVCLPWYYEMFTFWRVDDESKIFWFRFIIHDHFARLGSGVHTTTPGGDFTYFILQGGYAMFPWVILIPGAFAIAGRLKVRSFNAADGVGLIAVLWFVVSWGLIGNSATKFHHYTFPMLPPLAILMGLFLDKLWEEGIDAHAMVLLIGVPIFILVGKDLSATPKNFTDLFVYNYDRPYPAFLTETPVLGSMTLKQLMGYGMAFGLTVVGLFAILRSRTMVFTSGLAAVLAFALWFNWSHWVNLSHHWTQRDQFWRYYTQRRGEEPVASFLMNWRGETFYSRNTVKQIKDNPQVGMRSYADQPGREWSFVEHARFNILKGAVGDKNVTLVDKDLNNKFILTTIE